VPALHQRSAGVKERRVGRRRAWEDIRKRQQAGGVDLDRVEAG
jgi:hypothetical protein